MSNKYKVKITSHDYPFRNIKNMVTKYHKEKSQSFMNSIKDIIKKPRKRKKRNKKTVNKKKERKKTYFKYMKNGGKKSKYNVKMARKFRRTRRKRGSGSRNYQPTKTPKEKCQERQEQIDAHKNYQNEFNTKIEKALPNFKRLKGELDYVNQLLNNFDPEQYGGGYWSDGAYERNNELKGRVKIAKENIEKLIQDTNEDIKYFNFWGGEDKNKLLEGDKNYFINKYNEKIEKYENDFKRNDCENVLKEGGRKSRRKRGGELSALWKKVKHGIKGDGMSSVVQEFMEKNDDFLTNMEDNCIKWFDSNDGEKFKKKLDDEIMKMQGKKRTGTSEEIAQQKLEFDVMVKMLDNLTPDPSLSKEDQENNLLDVCDALKGQKILYTKQGGKRKSRRKKRRKSRRRKKRTRRRRRKKR